MLAEQFADTMIAFADDNEAKEDLLDHYMDAGLIQHQAAGKKDGNRAILFIFTDDSMIEMIVKNNTIHMTIIPKEQRGAFIKDMISKLSPEKMAEAKIIIEAEMERREPC